MNILIITAHPSPTGVTKAIANTYATARQSKKHIIQIVDLYAPEYQVENFTFTNIKEYKPSKIQLKFQEQLLWADEIVIVHPIWWGTVPAVLKNWVDLTFWPNVAYKYTPSGSIQKLLTGKTAKIFATSGGPAWYHHLFFMPFTSFWKLSVLEFTGVDVMTIKICGNLDKLKDTKRTKHIDKFLHTVRNS